MKRNSFNFNLLAVAFGKAMREKRLALGLDYEEVSKIVGLKQSYLKSIEVGNFCLSARNSRTISTVLFWEAKAVALLLNIISELGSDPSKEFSDIILSFWAEEIKEFEFLKNKNFEGLDDILNRGLQNTNAETKITNLLHEYPETKDLLKKLLNCL